MVVNYRQHLGAHVVTIGGDRGDDTSSRPDKEFTQLPTLASTMGVPVYMVWATCGLAPKFLNAFWFLKF
jgi:hypothetical protein